MPGIKGDVVRDLMPNEWDAAERRRSLFQHWVEDDYEVVKGVLRWVRDSEEEGGGYLPMATPSIVGDFLRLRIGDTEGLCAFARRWGALDYMELTLGDKRNRALGDPVAWVWAHLAGMKSALMLWKFWREKDVDALARYLDRRRLPESKWQSLREIDKLLVKGKFVDAQERIETHLAELRREERAVGDIVLVAGDESKIALVVSPGEHTDVRSWVEAWKMIRRIINPNLRGVHAEISPYFDKEPGEPIVALGWDSLLSVIYRHVFEIMASGQVEECRECGTPFTRTDGRQRFCPPTPPARESQCAMRFHKREQRQRQKRPASSSDSAT
jgi:hypothetical protein